MDLLDFDAGEMYFEAPLSAEVDTLLSQAASRFGEAASEQALLRAYFMEPEHLTVLVALYRYFYFTHRYRDALLVADRAIAVTASRLGLSPSWKDLSSKQLGKAAEQSMTLTRFLLLALKGAGYLELRLDDPEGALARFEKVLETDAENRLGTAELAEMARARSREGWAETHV